MPGSSWAPTRTRSTVRAELGIGLRHLGTRAQAVQVLFTPNLAPLLSRDGVPRLPHVLTLVDAPQPAALCPMGAGRWSYVALRFDGGRPDVPYDWTATLRAAPGLPDLEPDVLDVVRFTLAAAVAATYRSGPGFLVGDAAHQTTPVAGIGPNTAVHDGHELGWKLAWVARGLAGEGLLDSHDAERGPVGLAAAQRSLDVEGRPTDGLASNLGHTHSSTWLPEPVLTAGGALGPLETAEQHESVSLALLVLLERLTPAERAVFVLREAFAYDHAEIAETLELTPANARQLYRRARQRMAEGRTRFWPDPEQRHRLVERFLAAARDGDTAGLERLLAAEAVSVADGGGRTTAARRPVRGRARVVRYLAGAFGRSAGGLEVGIAEINGEPALWGWAGAHLVGVAVPEFVGEQIVTLPGPGAWRGRGSGPWPPCRPGRRSRRRGRREALGVAPERIYVDHGLTGTNRDRPGLREAMAACRGGDVLVVTKLDRLARSLPDARDIVAELTARHVKLSLGGSVPDPTDPVGRLLFNVLAMVTVRVRPDQDENPGGHEGRPRQGPATWEEAQAVPATGAHLVQLHQAGTHTIAELAELFFVRR